MSEEITGRVVYVTDDKDARLVVIETVTSNNYTRRIACRFWGDKRKPQTIGVGVGDEVKVIGGVESREGKGTYVGRWFTNFEAFKLTKLSGVDTRDPVDPPADDDVAF